MTSRTLISAVALATLTLLTACGGGEASDDNAANRAQASGVGGIGGSGVATQGVGGIGGSGVAAQGVGGIGGSGVQTQGVGGIGGSGVTAQGVGGIGGSGIQSVARTQTCGLQSVNVTIAGARLNTDGAANLGSEGWVDVALATPVRVDLLSGASLPLDLSGLPAGTYREMRLLLVVDAASAPLANSVVGATGVETALAVPASLPMAVDIAVAVAVAGGQASASFSGLAVCQAVASSAGVWSLDAVTRGATQVASAS
jgi:hypothetical protein